MKQGLAGQPWFILFQHFLRRYFDTDLESGELKTGIPAMLAFAATPGLIACALLFDKYSTLKGWFLGVYVLDRDVTTLPDKYIFLTLAFVISGLATVFKWDSLFPDRRDYFVLAPLPLSPMLVFGAKFAALSVFVMLFALAVNVAGAVFFPPVVLGNTETFPLLLRYFAAHFAAAVAASLGGALFVIASAGLLLNVLPAATMRRASSWLQFLFLVLFLTQLFLAPRLATNILDIYNGPAWRSLMLPSMWFVGLYEAVLARSSMDLSRWAEWSRTALVGSAACAGVTFVAGYFRHFSRTGEMSEAGVAPSPVWRLLPAPREPREAAIVDFVKQTIQRSALHRMILRVFLGLATAVILQELLATTVVKHLTDANGTFMALSSPLIVSFFLLVGLRLLLEIPADRGAAWAFHITLDESATEPLLRGVRRVVFEMGVLAWLLVITPVNLVLLGPTLGAAHSGFCFIVSLLLLDGLLFTYRRIPFTCSLSSERTYLGAAIAAWCALFVTYSYGLISLELALLRHSTAFAIGVSVMLAAWLQLRSRKREWSQLHTHLDLAGRGQPIVLTLDLQPK